MTCLVWILLVKEVAYANRGSALIPVRRLDHDRVRDFELPGFVSRPVPENSNATNNFLAVIIG